MKSIKSILTISFIIVGVSLLLVIILSIRQFQLTRQYTEITTISERTLFAFGTIREQVTQSLITRDFRQLKTIIPEIELLNNSISRLYDSGIVPGEFKLAMADNIDLSGLAISLRKIDSEQNQTEAGLKLQEEMRLVSDSLIKVDRIISGQIRDSVVSFQLSFIGVMGVLISCASFILIVLYRKAVKPLLGLSEQAAEEAVGERGFICQQEAGSEIVQFITSVNELLERVPSSGDSGSAGTLHKGEIVSTTINETTNSLNGILNYAQLLLESDTENQLDEQQRQMLEKIINNGEKIAAQWQQISQRFSA
jgi:hypothetical protein